MTSPFPRAVPRTQPGDNEPLVGFLHLTAALPSLHTKVVVAESEPVVLGRLGDDVEDPQTLLVPPGEGVDVLVLILILLRELVLPSLERLLVLRVVAAVVAGSEQDGVAHTLLSPLETQVSFISC